MKDHIRNMKQLGQALRKRRLLQKLTQKNLALKTGLRQATISDIEKGRHITGDSLFRLLNTLKIQIVFKGISPTREVYDVDEDFDV